MDQDLEIEPFAELQERLASGSPRQQEIERLTTGLLEPSVNCEPMIGALRALVVGAVREGDDPALELAADGLYRAYAAWRSQTDPVQIEHRGEIRGLHNLADAALEVMVPVGVLAELEPDSLAHRMLAAIAERRGLGNDDLEADLDADKSSLSRAGTRLRSVGLARSRRAGRRNAWEITPRGAEVINALAMGGRPTLRGRERTRL